MRRIRIQGGEPLRGEVGVSGSKNATLPILAASLLIPGETILEHAPNLLDVITMIRVLRTLGVRAEYSENGNHHGTVRVATNHSIKHVAPYELVTKMRASFFVIGPLLARKGLAKVPLPGGCAIGSRPVDIHLKGLEALGAKIYMERGFVIARADKLVGAEVKLSFPSVGATETVMMAALGADGPTEIIGAAKEPEIVDLAGFLKSAGASIQGEGSDRIQVEGNAKLHSTKYTVIPDRIETATLLLAAVAAGGEVTLRNTCPAHIGALLEILERAGVNIRIFADQITVRRDRPLDAVQVQTAPYPGFPTDMQPLLTAVLATALGTSTIEETIFENRLLHVAELRRLGARVEVDGRVITIHSRPKLSGAPVRAMDLRGGAALVIAALAAEGETIITDVGQCISRGYDELVGNLGQLGAAATLVVPHPVPHVQIHGPVHTV